MSTSHREAAMAYNNIKDIEELEKELVSITKEEYNTKYNNIWAW